MSVPRGSKVVSVTFKPGADTSAWRPAVKFRPRGVFNAICVDLRDINVIPNGKFPVNKEQAELLAGLATYMQASIFPYGPRYVGQLKTHADDLRRAWKDTPLYAYAAYRDDLNIDLTLRDMLGQTPADVIANLELVYPQANIIILDHNRVDLPNGKKDPRWIKVDEDAGLTIQNARTAVNRLGGKWQSFNAWHRKGMPDLKK